MDWWLLGFVLWEWDFHLLMEDESGRNHCKNIANFSIKSAHFGTLMQGLKFLTVATARSESSFYELAHNLLT